MTTPTFYVNSTEHAIGSVADAKLILVEYGDFECPDCLEAYPHVKNWKQKFGDAICVVFRHMPLDQLYPIHPNATYAACVAEAAGMQGRFWEMHDMLFEHQADLSEEACIGYAETLGLSLEKFHEDVQSEAVKELVLDSVERGESYGVTSTPGFFIHGVLEKNSRDYAAIEAKLEELLAVTS